MQLEKEKFYVSYTKMDTLKKCPMSYFYKYIMKLEKKVPRRSFYIGEDIHKLIELFYLHKAPDLLAARQGLLEEHMAKADQLMNPEEMAEFMQKGKELTADIFTWREYIEHVIYPRFESEGDNVKAELGMNYVNDIIKIMGQYEYYYMNDNLKVIDLENKKYAELGEYNGKQVVLSYISDGVVEVNGKQYLLEHKSFKDSPMSYEDAWLNVQTAEYVTQLNKEGYKIEGVIWDNIKSAAPKEPNVLKNGSYGKHYGTHSLFSFISVGDIMKGYKAVCEAAAGVMDTVNKLEISNNHSGFLDRHITMFNDNAVAAIRKDSDEVINIMTSDSCPKFRNMGQPCGWCSFRDLCRLEMLGEPTEELINTMYTKRGE